MQKEIKFRGLCMKIRAVLTIILLTTVSTFAQNVQKNFELKMNFSTFKVTTVNDILAEKLELHFWEKFLRKKVLQPTHIKYEYTFKRRYKKAVIKFLRDYKTN